MVGGVKWRPGCSNRLGAVTQIHSQSFMATFLMNGGFVKRKAEKEELFI